MGRRGRGRLQCGWDREVHADEVGRRGRGRQQCGWDREVQMRWAGGVEAGSSVAEIGRCR